MPSAKAAAICLWTWLAVVLFVSAFLIGYSFDTLGPNTMAFLFNRNTMYLHADHVYNAMPGDSGRWYVGLGSGFEYRFPRLHQTVRMDDKDKSPLNPIFGLSSEGALVQMSLSFIYKLPRTAPELHEFFMRFGGKHEHFINTYVASAARDVIGDVSVFDLFQNRSDIKTRLHAEVSAALAPHFCTLDSVQVLDLQIPEALREAIEQTTVYQQRIFRAQFNQNAQRVAAETEKITTQQQAIIGVRDANATAYAAVTIAQANARALMYTAAKEADAYANVTATLDLNSSTLLTYVWLDALAASNASKTLLSIKPSGATVFP